MAEKPLPAKWEKRLKQLALGFLKPGSSWEDARAAAMEQLEYEMTRESKKDSKKDKPQPGLFGV